MLKPSYCLGESHSLAMLCVDHLLPLFLYICIDYKYVSDFACFVDSMCMVHILGIICVYIYVYIYKIMFCVRT